MATALLGESPEGDSGDEARDDDEDSSISEKIMSLCGFNFLALTIGGGITLVFCVMLWADWMEMTAPYIPEYDGTFVVVVAPPSCTLSDEDSVVLREGVALLSSAQSPDADASCFQAGSMAKAAISMGLNGSLLHLDYNLRESLPRALLVASSLKQRTAVIVWDHAIAQTLVNREWIRLLQMAEPGNVRWASIGNNLRDDRLARDTLSCMDHVNLQTGEYGHSDCGCSDVHSGYADCLAGLFNLAVLMLHRKADNLRSLLGRRRLSGAEPVFSAVYTNSVAAETLWNSTWSRRSNVNDLRIMVDCSGNSEQRTDEESILEMLWRGVDRYHAANPRRLRVNATTFNCQMDVHPDVLHLGELSPARFLEDLQSYDAYIPVSTDAVSYANRVPQAQVAGLAVLSIHNDLGREFIEEAVTGFLPQRNVDVQHALETIEQGLVSNTLRRHIHEAAQQRFSARKALQDILVALFPNIVRKVVIEHGYQLL